jgi:hypothetical protein
LILKTDYGTNNYTQWFYFKVTNMTKFRTYTFHILNFVKPDSSFNDGMKPLVYSTSEAEETDVGWMRMGEDVAYY